MEITVRGKHVDVPEQVEERARRKLVRLDRYLPLLRDAVVEVDVAQERAKEPSRRFLVRATVSGNGVHLRAEEHAARLESAVDLVVRVLTEQARRYKQRLYERGRNATAQERARRLASPLLPADAEAEDEEEAPELRKVAEVRRVAVKPMTVEEAVAQIELLGRDFLLFVEEDARHVALLYRRPDGDYGLLIPELT